MAANITHPGHSGRNDGDPVRRLGKRVVSIVSTLSHDWTRFDAEDTQKDDLTALYLLCGAGLVESRYRGKAWSDGIKSLQIEATARGVWIDFDRESILPDEVRRAVPAWHGKVVAIQLDRQFESRITTFGDENRSRLGDDTGMFLLYLTANPIQGRCSVRILGESVDAPGVERKPVVDSVRGPEVEALRGIESAIRLASTKYSPAPAHTTGNKPPSIDERMAATAMRNPEAIYWSIRQWATHLGCANASVGNQPSWEKFQQLQAESRAEAVRRRRDAEGKTPP